MEPVKVFISYSHDSPEHMQRVLQLANALRAHGVDAEIDRYYVRPPRGWPQWCEEQLRPTVSRFVLVVCTALYRQRAEGEGPTDEGRGVAWEGAIIYSYMYDAKGNQRFIPVLLNEEPGSSLPQPLAGQTFYRVRDFELTDTGFRALYRELTGQLEVTKPGLGKVEILTRGFVASAEPDTEAVVASPLPKREVKSTFDPAPPPTPPPPPPADLDRIYIYAPTQLIGRAAETAIIEDAWTRAARGEPHPQVLAFVALGGEGKTSLVASWANGLAARGWPGCASAFAWSFYRQGSSEQAGASSDLFFAEALKFFGLPIVERESGYEKGKRLARELGGRRALLILDGLEPLQYPPGSPMAGRLKDDALAALLKSLATRNSGLCLVTTRYEIVDIEGYGATTKQHELGGLSEEAGVALLTALGVKGADEAKRSLVADADGHPLTLEIIGSYLKRAHRGDIARRDRIRLETAAEAKGGHAMRAMAEYASWLRTAGEEGARALAMLRLTGLFDRPANAGCLGALWPAPAIEGLTEPLVDLSEEERNIALSDLEAGRLITVKREGAALVEVDAHPLLRAYFAGELGDTPAWREGHRRLYVHLTTTTEDKEAPTLDDLKPLYQAVAHGCAAGLWQEACEVYETRICRDAKFYTVKKLGAFGSDLGAVACFFAKPWREVSPRLGPDTRAWLLSVAGFLLRALGRLAESGEPMRAGMDGLVALEDWMSAARAASNLSELELTLGRIDASVTLAEAASAHAARSGNAVQRMVNCTTEADARHQAGGGAEVEVLFRAAEAMQAEREPRYPILCSLGGFQYGDWQLGPGERVAWLRLVAPSQADAPGAEGSQETALTACAKGVARGEKMFEWRVESDPLLDIGLDHLTIARAALYAAVLRGDPPRGEHLGEAVDFLRRAGQQQFVPLPLLTRALYRAVTNDFPGTREDLDEAYEIAERGPMRLHLADIHLHRARLFGLLANRPADYPWTSPQADLAEARKLIERCGYGRRLPELEDAEAALKARG